MEQQVTVLTVAYDGSGFAGFARQASAVTIQGRLEEALATALRRPVETVGAGRTDAGVHALGQVVSFESSPGDPAAPELARAVTALAGPGIAVRQVRYAREGFSARFDATAREYRYRLCAGPVPPVLSAHLSWHVAKDLDVDMMNAAASALLGEHDFRSFCVAASAEGKRTVRRLDALVVYPEDLWGEEGVTIRVVGNAFLHSMVRVIAGTLVEVGSGRRPIEWVADALAARDRSAAGPTAPPHGLVLWSVDYPDEVWVR